MRVRLPRLLRRAEPERPSIYDHIRSHLPAVGTGLTEGGDTLPDEADLAGPIRWAPGARDGVGVYHMGGDFGVADADEVIRLIGRSATGRDKDLRELERALRDIEPLAIVDPLLQRIQGSQLSPSRIEHVGLHLATTSMSRNPVKIGIALIGVVVGRSHRDVLMTLGRHDEFTLYCAVALGNTEPDPDTALWELAKLVTGWGRVHLVERLKDTSRPEIRDWILRTGFRNSIMDEYLVYIAATTGGLVSALDRDHPDDAVIDAACDITCALINGGPAEDIDDYEDAPRATELLVGHLGTRATALHHLLALAEVSRFLDGDGERWIEREAGNWPGDLRPRLGSACREILARPDWAGLVAAGLASSEPVTFDEARRAGEILGIDTFEAQLVRLAADPLDGDWFAVMGFTDAARLPRVLELAQESLPLTEIATGPADEFGFGPEFRAQMALGSVVQGLGRFPGEGWTLIAAALRSPVVSNRNGALSALDAWDRSDWPNEARTVLESAARIEPDKELRDRMERLARGEPAPVAPVILL